MRPETAVALRAASAARDLADSREGAGELTSKGGIDLVTGADLRCEDAIRAALIRAFPAYPVIGEERGGTASGDAPYWLVDPICGTRLYASEVPLYCTNVALVERGVVTAAAVAAGCTGELAWAERGAGAFRREGDRDHPICVAGASRAIWIDGPVGPAADVVRAAMLRGTWYVWKYSSSISYLQLALGRIAGIVHFFHGPNPLHSAAGALVAHEAGAIVTDLDGEPWTLASAGLVLAATAALHRELLALTREARSPASPSPEDDDPCPD